MDYAAHIERKLSTVPATGIVGSPVLPRSMFPFQTALTAWALRRGRAAIFADTGLGKSRMQLAWADAVRRHTDRPVLILAPLAVAPQTVAEGVEIGVEVKHCRDGSEAVGQSIVITNYDRLHRFRPDDFGAVVLDESSCIKHHDAKTLRTLLTAFRDTPFKLCATATPAPNDWTELGTHAEFLGVCTRQEMLAEFFTHDGGDTSVWRLKGHARHLFWQWVCQWGALVRRPSDLGFDDTAYILPPLHLHEHTVSTEMPANEGMLFADEAQTLSERRYARKFSVEDRVNDCAAMVNSDHEPWVVWCDLNAEGDALEAAIPGSIQVAGSDSIEFKEQAVEWFSGSRCICDAPEFRSKLAEWRKQTTSATTTPPTVSDASRNLAITSADTQTSVAHTTRPTTQQTRGESLLRLLSTEQEPLSSARPSARPSTPRILNDSSEPQRNGRQPIQGSDSTSGCANTASLAPTTHACSPTKTADAPSAIQSRPATSAAEDSTLTIATSRGGFAGFSAPNAISGSENSRTQPTSSNALPCICGHRSGRRVLVSKCSITGFGLNWQHASHMAFVGVTDSFEAYYQAVRREWRFGQKRDVHVHVFASSAEGAVVANLKRKERDAIEMSELLSAETRDAVMQEVTGTKRSTNLYNGTRAVKAPAWL